jgi:hypothetical protein
MSEFSEGMAVGQSIGQNNCANNGWNNGFGGDGWWILLLLLCGWGNNSWGGNGNGQFMNYEIGRLATTNDVASGFSTSSIMSTQREMQLALTSGFADVQQILCQGFSGVNATVNAVGNTINQGICNLGFNMQTGLFGVQKQISDCCCNLGRAIDGVNYNMAKNTCDIIQAGHNDTQRLLDYWNCKELAAKDLQIAQLTSRLDRNDQTTVLLNAINKPPYPAYVVPNPHCCNPNPCCGG